mmetsp:Transcript_26530/g.73236  ORF Transcript_26530/g.73236 Transcript_26530/m.73236 type:complete len:103 (+) Transcript_26530:3-311(+)
MFTGGDDNCNERLQNATGGFNLEAFDTISIKESEGIYSELSKAFKSFRKWMTRSGTNDSDPWDFVDRVYKDASGIGKVEAVYFYLFCSQSTSRLADLAPFRD